MKVLLWLCLLHADVQKSAVLNLSEIRKLYESAPLVKQDAKKLDQLMLNVNVNNANPVLICYKGASELIDAKYTINPITKFDDFNKGKALINKAISRDTLNLEMRFIRYSIQSNLPGFLGYSDNLENDKNFLLINILNIKDQQLKEMILNYLSGKVATKI
ncbi:hypothetical protein [Mucilaginibacter sp.]